MSAAAVNIVTGSWADLHRDATQVRTEVFVNEQAVPAELELDDADADAWHAVAYGHDGAVLGTGRLLPDGHIGRMAVVKSARGAGVGAGILQALIAVARQSGKQRLDLNAQVHAQGFYERHGFRATGAPFLDAGIVHVAMFRVWP